MRNRSLFLTLGFIGAFALATSRVRAQGDQSNIISQQGDALSRSTSAEALVAPKPARPPNSAAPAVPSNSPEPSSASPAPASNGASLVTYSSPAIPRDSAPLAVPAASGNSVPPATVPPASPQGSGRGVLILIGALIALAMFLWERRRKD
jgi:hypothetical protein